MLRIGNWFPTYLATYSNTLERASFLMITPARYVFLEVKTCAASFAMHRQVNRRKASLKLWSTAEMNVEASSIPAV